MSRNKLFWVFGLLQSLSLGMIIFLSFRSLGMINGEPVIGLDSNITLSISFPLFLLIVEYLVYSSRN